MAVPDIAGKARNQRFKNLVDLGEGKLTLINNALLRGSSTTKVARLVQQDWKDCLKLSEATLARHLARYREIVLAPTIVARTQSDAPDSVGLTHVLEDNSVSVVDELSKLVRIQMERINVGVTKEKTIGMPLTAVSRDVEVAKVLLESLSKHQFDIGMLEFKGMFSPQGKVSAKMNADGSVEIEHSFENVVQEAQRIIESSSVDIQDAEEIPRDQITNDPE